MEAERKKEKDSRRRSSFFFSMKARFGARYRRKKKGSRRHAPRIIIIITITVTVRIRITRERERKVPFQTPADACSKRERKQFRGSWSAQPTLTLNRIPLVFLSTHMRALGSLSPFAKSEASIRATKEEEEEEGGGGGGGRLRGNANSDKKLESISLCSLFISFFASFARVDGLKGEGEGEESFFLPYPFSSSPPFSAARFSLEEREAAWPFPIMETRMSGVI